MSMTIFGFIIVCVLTNPSNRSGKVLKKNRVLRVKNVGKLTDCNGVSKNILSSLKILKALFCIFAFWLCPLSRNLTLKFPHFCNQNAKSEMKWFRFGRRSGFQVPADTNPFWCSVTFVQGSLSNTWTFDCDEVGMFNSSLRIDSGLTGKRGNVVIWTILMGKCNTLSSYEVEANPNQNLNLGETKKLTLWRRPDCKCLESEAPDCIPDWAFRAKTLPTSPI